jgi:hypothetical protein
MTFCFIRSAFHDPLIIGALCVPSVNPCLVGRSSTESATWKQKVESSAIFFVALFCGRHRDA